MNKSNTNVFVKKMQDKYGDVYDYSQVHYINASKPVTVVCKKHGPFVKSPNTLLRGYGCNQCRAEQRLISEDEKKANYAKRAEKRKQTMKSRYGVENPMQLDSVKEKVKQTCIERYGVENPRQLVDVVDKARQTNVERYGAISYAKSEKGLAQIQQTMQERYGSDNFMKSDAHFDVLDSMKEKSKQTQLQRYGTEHYSQSNEAKLLQGVRKQKEYDTKRKNHSFHTSSVEAKLKLRLKTYFGDEDVICQFVSDVYPFACDFYIKSRHMYIELNATWTHGKHWYDECRVYDNDKLNSWLEKSDYYDNAIQTWTDRDVKKRQVACQNKLNYVVFWYADLQDADLWFAMGCPDGQDWKREYSWLPERELYFDKKFFEKQTATQASMIVKKYQFDVFYQRELRMWNENELYHGIPLQAYLYINRYHYIQKLPWELSSIALLNGFTISGILKNYTRFNFVLMQHVLDKYSDITEIYDPFAGWGERMVCAAWNHKCYFGCDVNELLNPGYQKMIQDLSLQHVEFHVCDSRQQKMPYVDGAVITCPPYYDIEQYTDYGLETFSYKDFLSAWREVVEQCCDAKYFCFQINQKFREDMVFIVQELGFVLIDEFCYDTVQSSHFTRKNGVNIKKEYEIMLVFKKI